MKHTLRRRAALADALAAARRTEAAILGHCPTELTEWLKGLWWIVLGLTYLFVPGIFASAPYLYAWMAPLPQWAWGLVILGVGVWQRVALLHVRTWPARFWAALGGDVLSLVLLIGYASRVRRTTAVGFYVLEVVASLICVLRLHQRGTRRKDGTRKDPGRRGRGGDGGGDGSPGGPGRDGGR